MPASANWRDIVTICRAEGFDDPNDVYKKAMLMFKKFRSYKWHRKQSPPRMKSKKETDMERRQLRRRFLDLFWKPLDKNKEEMEKLVEDAMDTAWFDDLIDFAVGILTLFNDGRTYRKLIERCYFNAAPGERQIDVAIELGMGSSCFSDKHKEAVTLIGIEAWMHAKNMEYEDMAKRIVEYHDIYPDNIPGKRDQSEYFLNYFEPHKKQKNQDPKKPKKQSAKLRKKKDGVKQ
ncbi:hypothetical protein D6855_14115 [Butyrivibrio sp. CB08]|uniref:hypothetical protein n=1 Tax=Butyrivibrio sp. CB08 TaxID=2364879 RepID=UPI000EA9EE23|nr:hypothetical protein [Butyrivibrio sp. CB08]RKM56800.1 hypothetical protein D6855_14115 [Butyrivibrio sp. CB08]